MHSSYMRAFTKNFLGLVVAIVMLAAPLQAAPPLITAGGEPLEGVALAGGGAGYFGIPYAAAPVGELRWKAPQPHVARIGKQPAKSFAAACPQDQGNSRWYRQVATAFGASPKDVPDLQTISEDCLYLNVWTPPANHRTPARGWPVMVWIYGGSNANGYSHEPNYYGEMLARRGVVVVSINYRVGTFGFLRHLALGDASGKQGLLDQVQALQWVQANISSFRGNPRNVTAFGESAGGANVYSLLRMREARGLIHKAIIQSGSMRGDRTLTTERAEAAAKIFFDSLGATDAAAMRRLPWQQIVAAQKSWPEGSYFAPVMEDAIAPARVPLLIGSNLDEWRMYLPQNLAETYRQSLNDFAGARASGADTYLLRMSDDPKTRADRLISGQYFLCPARDVATESAIAGNATYAYYFTRIRPGEHGLGAYHGAEIPYVFDTADSWLRHSSIDRRLTQQISRYWTNFARTGNPNSAALEHWPRFTPGSGPFELGDMTRALDANIYEICQYLGKQH
jgi:para-nitrobenzyl esterase